MPTFQSNATEQLFIVSSGDLTDFIYVRPSVLEGGTIDGNWTCNSWVERDNGTVIIESFAITEKSGDSTEFKCYLTGEQTAALSNGNGNSVHEYDWIITLENALLSPAQNRTLRLRLGVA